MSPLLVTHPFPALRPQQQRHWPPVSAGNNPTTSCERCHITPPLALLTLGHPALQPLSQLPWPPVSIRLATLPPTIHLTHLECLLDFPTTVTLTLDCHPMCTRPAASATASLATCHRQAGTLASHPHLVTHITLLLILALLSPFVTESPALQPL